MKTYLISNSQVFLDQSRKIMSRTVSYFHVEQFIREYYKLDNFPKDTEILNKQTKPKLNESVMIAPAALHWTTSYMKRKQTVWIFCKISEWNIERTEIPRSSSGNSIINSPYENSSKNISDTDAVQYWKLNLHLNKKNVCSSLIPETLMEQ